MYYANRWNVSFVLFDKEAYNTAINKDISVKNKYLILKKALEVVDMESIFKNKQISYFVDNKILSEDLIRYDYRQAQLVLKYFDELDRYDSSMMMYENLNDYYIFFQSSAYLKNIWFCKPKIMFTHHMLSAAKEGSSELNKILNTTSFLGRNEYLQKGFDYESLDEKTAKKINEYTMLHYLEGENLPKFITQERPIFRDMLEGIGKQKYLCWIVRT
ncbi:hypothetical protein ACE193_17000 [Bernardetia sp. OM2101]|uniref:hypothetical protein n=1 Tax=Bernardetia sp. OM2101 TaxID=3344876 RepID=UPI0035D0E84C